MKVAIFGGSFNPVHNEHVKIATQAVKELMLDKLFILPANIAPHKKNQSLMDAKVRLNALKCAFENQDKIEVCDYEISKQGVSYTYQTILHFKKLYKDAELFFILGSDMLENFPTWKNPEIIAKNATLALTKRKNGEFDDEVLIEKVESLYNVKIKRLSVYGTTVSSTKIRVYKKLGLSVSDLLPKTVENYLDSVNAFEGDYLYDYVKKTLPEKRRVHTAGVILTAISLAKKLKVDVNKAEISSLLHDVAKYKNPLDYKDFQMDDGVCEDVIHQFLGEYIVKNELNITDQDVLLAIKYHTTGREQMTMLEKIVYIADLIEPSRKFVGVEKIREEIEKDFDSGFNYALEEIVDFLIKSGKPVYPLTLKAFKYYKGE